MLTKKEAIFVADKVKTYRNTNGRDWLSKESGLSRKNRQYAELVVKLPLKILTQYG